MFRIVTANVNGIRAAARRGGLQWPADTDTDTDALENCPDCRAASYAERWSDHALVLTEFRTN